MTALATLPAQPNMAIVRDDWTDDKLDLLKRTICKGGTNDELDLFIQVCKKTGLDPFSKQIYAVKRWDSKAKREVMSVQTGIDGYRAIAERTGCYAGSDDPVYDSEDGKFPNKASVTVWKIVGGQRVPFTASARWAEYVQKSKEGQPTRFWAQMPYLMLGKVAEALALRKAFPNDLSGIYTAEEMAQADNDQPVGDSGGKTSLKDRLKGNAAPLVESVKEVLGGEVVAETISPEEEADWMNKFNLACGIRGIDNAAADKIYTDVTASKKFKDAYKASPAEAWARLVTRVEEGAFDPK